GGAELDPGGGFRPKQRLQAGAEELRAVNGQVKPVADQQPTVFHRAAVRAVRRAAHQLVTIDIAIAGCTDRGGDTVILVAASDERIDGVLADAARLHLLVEGE